MNGYSILGISKSNPYNLNLPFHLSAAHAL